MKLSLERVRDISVLYVLGPISEENFAVLRAGIRKLFQEGKNRIILEVPEADPLSPDLLRELVRLNALASELSGQIVLAGVEPLIRMRIDAFAKPALIRSFLTRAEALDFFFPPITERPLKLAAAVAPPASAPEKLTAEAAVGLEVENRQLREQLAALIVQRRATPDLVTAHLRIRDLEEQLNRLLEEPKN